jgi:hypothetical protein
MGGREAKIMLRGVFKKEVYSEMKIFKLYVRHPNWRFNTGFFPNELISHHQPPLNLIFISEQTGSGFYEAIFRLFIIRRAHFILGHERA